MNDSFNVDLPSKLKKKLLSKIKEYLMKVKTDYMNKNEIPESKYIFHCTIMNIFHKFFVNLLSGYTKYLISPNHNYFGDNIRHKLKEKNDYLSYIKEIFDYNENIFIYNYSIICKKIIRIYLINTKNKIIL